jgi:hypothetical protein
VVPKYPVDTDWGFEGISPRNAVRIPHNRSNYSVSEPGISHLLQVEIPLRVILRYRLSLDPFHVSISLHRRDIHVTF